jgi:hypothetical protein
MNGIAIQLRLTLQYTTHASAATVSSATCGSTRLVNHRWSTRLQCRGQRAIFAVDQPLHGLA